MEDRRVRKSRWHIQCTENLLGVYCEFSLSIDAHCQPSRPFPSSLIHLVFWVYVWLVNSHKMLLCVREKRQKGWWKSDSEKRRWGDVEYNVRREWRGNKPSSLSSRGRFRVPFTSLFKASDHLGIYPFPKRTVEQNVMNGRTASKRKCWVDSFLLFLLHCLHPRCSLSLAFPASSSHIFSLSFLSM